METKVKNYIVSKLKEYSKIPSVTGNETEFLEYLEKDFNGNKSQSWRSVKLDFQFSYKLLYNKESRSPYVFTVHTDRVCDYRENKPFESEIRSIGNKIVKGQLDNIISIAILRYLHSLGYSMNVLFTTREEICRSYEQIQEVMILYGFIPVSLDIDPVKDELFQGSDHITIREESFSFSYDPDTVALFQKIAIENNIPFSNKDGFSHDEIYHLMRATQSVYKGAHLGLPLKNYHTNDEEVNWSSIFYMIEFLKALLTKETDTLLLIENNNEITLRERS